MYFWDTDAKGKSRCLFGDAPRTSFSCVTADDQGRCFAGASNSRIYVWNGQNLETTIQAHGKGFISSIMWNSGKIYSGGRDGFVRITNSESFEVEKSIDFGVLPRAIDVVD